MNIIKNIYYSFKYFTTLANVLLIICVFLHYLKKNYSHKFTKSQIQTINNILALNYGVTMAASITGIIIVNVYDCCAIMKGKYKYNLELIRILDFAHHIIPLIVATYIAPESNDVSINRIFLYSSFLILAIPYVALVNAEKLYVNVPSYIVYYMPIIVSFITSYIKYPPNKKPHFKQPFQP